MFSATNKIIMKAILVALVATGLVVAAGSFVGVSADSHTTADSACRGLELAGGTCDDTTDPDSTIGTVVTTIINILSIIVGAVSVIMIIIGGFRYVTSAGDASRVASAKNTIIYAIVGLIIVIFAQVIVSFVVTRIQEEPAPAAIRNTPTLHVS